MADKSASGKIPLTIYLPEELARRLQAAATAQSRNAAELVVGVLDRYLPRKTEESKKGKIPYA
jgi:predicted transcriptional regulator